MVSLFHVPQKQLLFPLTLATCTARLCDVSILKTLMTSTNQETLHYVILSTFLFLRQNIFLPHPILEHPQ